MDSFISSSSFLSDLDENLELVWEAGRIGSPEPTLWVSSLNAAKPLCGYLINFRLYRTLHRQASHQIMTLFEIP